MKCTFFVVSFFITASCLAQTTFRISKRTFCYYNPATQQPDNCGPGNDYTCSFVLSADSTSFDWVFVDSKYHYRVLEKEYDADNDQYFYSVQDDNGHKDLFQISYSQKAFIILPKPINEMVETDAVSIFLIDEITP